MFGVIHLDSPDSAPPDRVWSNFRLSLPPAGEVENSPLLAGETIAALNMVAIFRVVTIEADLGIHSERH